MKLIMPRVWLALLLACLPTVATAETLLDVIRMAYDSNPTLRAQRAELRATDERYVQAKAGYGPQVSVSAQYGVQSARVQEPASFFTPATTTNYRANTGSADLGLAQPLYSFGATRAEVRGAAATVAAGRDALRQTESQVLTNAITAYVDVRRDRKILQILKDEIVDLTRDYHETEARQSAGQLSRVDLAEAQERLLLAQSQFELAQGHLDGSVAEYLDVIGESPGELEAEPDLLAIPSAVDQAYEAAEHNNAQLSQAIENERAAREAVNQAKAANGPTITAKLDAAIAPVEPYLPRQYDQNVTAAVVFSMPLFTSGMNSSKIREALDEDYRAELNIEEARRGVIQLVTQAWTQLSAARRAITIGNRQIEAETLSTVGNRAEEQSGLRTTIDMLNAEQELADSRVTMANSQHDEYVARVNLLAAMGLLQANFIAPGGEVYSADEAFKRVRNIGSLPWEKVIAALDAVGAPISQEPKTSTPAGGDVRPTNLPALPAAPTAR